jgi:hypothetical protein
MTAMVIGLQGGPGREPRRLAAAGDVVTGDQAGIRRLLDVSGSSSQIIDL